MTQNNRVQYWAAFAVAIATMATSTAYFWTAPILPKIHNKEISLNLTSSEISWVVSMIAPGMVTGSLVASSISDKFGRRATLLSSAAPFVIGTVFVVYALNTWLLYFGRFLWGNGTGMITTVSSVYLSEIADKDIRGTLTAGTRFMFSFGALVVLAVGSFVSYQVLSCFMIVLPLCYFIACWKIPESPYYLLKEGKVDEARKELVRLTGMKNEKMLEEKLSMMRSDVRKEMLRSSSVKELLTGKQYRKAVIVTTGLRVTQLMAGSIPIQQYLGRIIQQSNCGLEVSTALIIFGAIRFAVGLVSPVIVDKIGRRPLLIYTYIGSSIMLGMVGSYFFVQKVVGIENESSNPFRFVVFIGIVCSIVISSMGFDTLIFIIPSEIFPINVRSVAMTVLNIFTAVVTFVAVKGYQIMEDWTGLYGVFWFYGLTAFSGAVFTYFVVPETKGKSLREIQIELQGNIYDDDADDALKKELEPEENVKENNELKELALALAGVTLGVSSGWTTTVLPKFHNNETRIYITDQEISWVAAIASPGYMTGSLTSSFIADKFGRRSAILSSALPIIIGTIMILSTATVWWLYIARFLWGIGMGIIGTISSIYLAEVSDKEVRGTVTSSFRYMMSFGNFLTMAVGSFVSFENITCLLLVLPLAYFSACCFIPETPYYLLKEGKLKEARAALLKLSSNKEDWVVEDRLSAMRLDVKKDMQSSSSIKELFTGKRYRKALIISIGLKITQIMSGTLAILQYLGRIFQESNTNINLSTALMVFGAVRFVVGIFSSVIVDKVGRRPLFISSYLGSSIALSTIGLYFFLQPTFSIFSSYIPFFGLMIISTIISIIGYDTLCFVITAEIFPLNIKSVAMTFQNILGGFLNFLVVKGYQEVKDVAGLTGVFWFFACSSLTGAVFSFFLVPETKGKSLREIQIQLQGELYDEVDKNIPNGVVKDDDDATELKELKPDNT